MGNMTMPQVWDSCPGAAGLVRHKPAALQNNCHQERGTRSSKATVTSCSARSSGCLGAEKDGGPDGSCLAGPPVTSPGPAPACVLPAPAAGGVLHRGRVTRGTVLAGSSCSGTHPVCRPREPHVQSAAPPAGPRHRGSRSRLANIEHETAPLCFAPSSSSPTARPGRPSSSHRARPCVRPVPVLSREHEGDNGRLFAEHLLWAGRVLAAHTCHHLCLYGPGWADWRS